VGGPTLVASHNLMHGARLRDLLPHYVELRDQAGLDVLCVQEDIATDDGRLSERIAGSLGGGFAVVRDDHPGLALVYDSDRVTCTTHALVPLPRLQSLSWFEKLYIAGGKTRPKFALVAELEPKSGDESFAVVSFHLDTAGCNGHRLRQVETIAQALCERGWQHRFVACGDTNAFSLRRQIATLRRVLSPFSAHGAEDPEVGPTHWFSRQREPKLTHRACVALGCLGLDLPRRYDVVCTNLRALARGQLRTPGSDHDLLWARLAH
jgi:endonuclease/exonuclease/phosphatase family metal-dependent hydrolase